MKESLLIVDDHPGFRRWARRMLLDEGFEVVGEATDGSSAVTATRELRPRVVLLDIRLPDRDGFSVAEELAREPSPPAIVLTSSREAWEYGKRLGASDARGFLPKHDLSGATIRAVIEGSGRR